MSFGFSVAAIAKEDTFGKNIVPNATLIIRDFSGSLITIYDDAALTSGSTGKTLDENGTYSGFVELAQGYKVSINGVENYMYIGVGGDGDGGAETSMLVNTVTLSGSITLTAEDSGKYYVYTDVGDATITVPNVSSESLGDGFTIFVDRSESAGKVTFLKESGVEKLKRAANDTNVVAVGGVVQLIKLSAAENKFTLVGQLEPRIPIIKAYTLVLGSHADQENNVSFDFLNLSSGKWYKISGFFTTEINDPDPASEDLKIFFSSPLGQYAFTSTYGKDTDNIAVETDFVSSSSGSTSSLKVNTAKSVSESGLRWCRIDGTFRSDSSGYIAIGIGYNVSEVGKTFDIDRGYIELTQIQEL